MKIEIGFMTNELMTILKEAQQKIDKLEEQVAQLKNLEIASAHLTAIVESSDDGIISKNLEGIILSWNKGAERIFGYTSEEIVGKSVTVLMPRDRYNEEPSILERLKRGERIDHYETVRI